MADGETKIADDRKENVAEYYCADFHANATLPRKTYGEVLEKPMGKIFSFPSNILIYID
jgi:hypothetical protein